MPFTYNISLAEKTYAAGARQPEFRIEAAPTTALNRVARGIGIEEGYWTTFAPGGAQMAQQGRTKILRVREPGEGLFAFLMKAWTFRKVEGHTDAHALKVWQESSSKCEGGLLLVCAAGFQFEAAIYHGRLRRFEVQADGSLQPVDQAVVAL